MAPAGGKAPVIWTSRRLLAWTVEYFGKCGIDSPRVRAEMLLAHVLGVPRLRLYTDLDRPAAELERAAFRALVERAAKHEPVDYLVGQTPFFAMTLKVSPAVLVPRPSTEALVEHVVQHARRTPGFHAPLIADIGTGSGAIAIALAKHVPASRVIATDVSAAALAIARENAAAQGVADRIEFREGDLLAPIGGVALSAAAAAVGASVSASGGQRFRYLVSNPPYISDAEWAEVAPNVKDYEPVAALRGGVDGLSHLRPLIAHARRHLETPGQLVLEIAAAHKAVALELAAAAGLRHAHVLADHEGLPRVLVAETE